MTVEDDVSTVYNYWFERAHIDKPNEAVEGAYRDRIKDRLSEGFQVQDLLWCVDHALFDEFYVEKLFYKRPDVIWKNAERVQAVVIMAKSGKKVPM